MGDDDDFDCEITNIGTMRIIIFDGAVCSLSGVRYVPKMRRNPISFGVLDSKGCSYSARGGIMNVTHSIRALMKAEK